MNGMIWKALGIVVCMLALAAPHAMAETITHMVTADTDFAKVVKNINASGVDDENVIELCADITLTGNHTLKRSTTIKSKDEDRKISMNGSNAGITVTGEKTVLNLGAKGYDKKLTIEGDTRVAFIYFLLVFYRISICLYHILSYTLYYTIFAGNYRTRIFPYICGDISKKKYMSDFWILNSNFNSEFLYVRST